jgi:hypothetical protein
MDFLITGDNRDRFYMDALLYKNSTSVVNSLPDYPEILSVDPGPTSATFSWTQASDNETPVNGLTYNLRVGTTPGGSEVLSPLSMENGTRQVVDMGNTQQNTTWVINGLDSTTTYYYSVQTIDNGKLASEFASEKLFVYEQTSIIGLTVDMKIYPNPSQGLFFIEFDEGIEFGSIEVMNATGTIVLRRKITSQRMIMDISDYANGVYLIRIRINGTIRIVKLIKY